MIAVFAGVAYACETTDAEVRGDMADLSEGGSTEGPAAPSGGESEPTSYTIRYVVEPYTYSVVSTEATITLKTIEALGAQAPAHQSFSAWILDGRTYAAGSTYVLTSAEAEFKAVFVPTEYTVTFKAAEGVVIGTPVVGAYGTSLTVPAAPSVEGMIFAGWLAEGADRPVAADTITAIGGTVVYTAVYVVDYKIVFIDGDKTYSTSVSTMTVPDVGERTGFTFLGWYTADGVQILDPATYAYTADTTLTAKWEPMNCYVTFTAGDIEVAVVAVLYGQTVVVPELPAGYSAWDHEFSTPVTADITVQAIAEEPAKASGLSDPVVATIAIIVGALVLAGCAGMVVAVRKGKIVIGRGPSAKLKNAPLEEEKKE